MFRTRFVTLLVAVMALLVLVALPAHAQRPDAPQYALRGPYPVGTREFQIDDGQENTLNATVWYPALNPDEVEEAITYRIMAFTLEGRALLDAPPDAANAPYPLVVFSHGSRGIRYQSLFLTEHLASHGFVVIAIDHPGNTTVDWLLDREGFNAAVLPNFANRPNDILRTIAFVDSLVASDDTLGQVIDASAIAMMGHSFGGYTSLSVGGARLDFTRLATWCDNPTPFEPGSLLEGVPMPASAASDQEQISRYACGLLDAANEIAALRGLDAAPDGLWPATNDPRVAALVLLAPSSATAFGPQGLAEITAPTLIIVGSEDQSTYPPSDAYPIFEQISSDQRMLAVLENAGHYIFVDDCPPVVLNFGLFDECSDDVWDMARAHDLTNHLTTAFLLATFYDDAQAEAALKPEAIDFTGVYYRQVNTP